jgi:hypothetical protein
VQCSSGKWIPIVNGTLLHSAVDPQKEAAAFIDREWDRISLVKSLVVFGLGGGFHIQELLKRKKFEIVVIEAEKPLAQSVKEKNPELCAQVEILAGFPPPFIFSEASFVRAVGQSYAVVKHPASMRAIPYYYTSVSQIFNERTVSRLKQLCEGHRPLLQFLDSLDISQDQVLTLPMVQEAMVRRGSGLDKEGLIFMALRELIV